MPPQAGTDLPTEIIDHVYGGELVGWYQRFFREHEDFAADRPAIEDAVWRVYQHAATVDQFVRALEEIAGSISRAKTIAIEILGNDFLKIEDYLGIDIPAYIKHLGGNPSLFVKEIPVADVVRGVMGGIGVAPSDPAIAKRIEHAVTSFLTGIRDQLETKDVLTRGTKVGGVGLDAATADRIVAALTIQLKELRDAGVIIRTETIKPPETSTFHLVKASKSSVMQPEDEAEIEQIRRKVVPGDVVGDKIRAAVDRVIQKTGAKFKSEDVSRRFRTAIESRVRDIRDYAETLDLLTRPSAQGGFGIPKEQVEKVLKVVEEEVRALHARTDGHGSLRVPAEALAKAGMATDHGLPTPPPMVSPSPAPTTPALPSPPPVATLVHPVPPTAAGRAGSRAAEPMPPTPSPPIPKPAPPPPTKPVPPPPPREIATSADGHRPPRNDTKWAPAPPPPPPTPSKPQAPTLGSGQAASPKPQAPPPPAVKQIPIAPPPLKPQAAPLRQGSEGQASPKLQAVLPPPLKPVAEALPPKANRQTSIGGDLKVAATPPSVIREYPSAIRAPSVSSAKPKMQDIRPVPARLVGPIEELQQLALADFRKIAKTPADAATRIAEKLALLEKDSYTKRAEGVKALRGSPLMAAYAEVVNAALLAKRGIETELKEHLTKDKSALSWEEFQALGWLNAQIRL